MIFRGALLSFAAFAWLSEADPRAAFYLAPPRFWELLAGAMLIGVSVPARWATLASTAGLALIAASGGDVARRKASRRLPLRRVALGLHDSAG